MLQLAHLLGGHHGLERVQHPLPGSGAAREVAEERVRHEGDGREHHDGRRARRAAAGAAEQDAGAVDRREPAEHEQERHPVEPADAGDLPVVGLGAGDAVEQVGGPLVDAGRLSAVLVDAGEPPLGNAPLRSPPGPRRRPPVAGSRGRCRTAPGRRPRGAGRTRRSAGWPPPPWRTARRRSGRGRAAHRARGAPPPGPGAAGGGRRPPAARAAPAAARTRRASGRTRTPLLSPRRTAYWAPDGNEARTPSSAIRHSLPGAVASDCTMGWRNAASCGLAGQHVLPVRAVQRGEGAEAGLAELLHHGRGHVEHGGQLVETGLEEGEQGAEGVHAGLERREHREGLWRERAEQRDEAHERLDSADLVRGGQAELRARLALGGRGGSGGRRKLGLSGEVGGRADDVNGGRRRRRRRDPRRKRRGDGPEVGDGRQRFPLLRAGRRADEGEVRTARRDRQRREGDEREDDDDPGDELDQLAPVALRRGRGGWRRCSRRPPRLALVPQRSLHRSHTSSGTQPRRMPMAKSLQPRQMPANASSEAATRSSPRTTWAAKNESEPEGEHCRGDRERGADRLGEALRRPRDQLLGQAETGRDHAGDELAERAQLRAGEHPGDEAVREDEREPAHVEGDGGDGHQDHAGGDEAGRDLVDGVGEADQLGAGPTVGGWCGGGRGDGAHDVVGVPSSWGRRPRTRSEITPAMPMAASATTSQTGASKLLSSTARRRPRSASWCPRRERPERREPQGRRSRPWSRRRRRTRRQERRPPWWWRWRRTAPAAAPRPAGTKVPSRCHSPVKLLNGPPTIWLVHVRE